MTLVLRRGINIEIGQAGCLRIYTSCLNINLELLYLFCLFDQDLTILENPVSLSPLADERIPSQLPTHSLPLILGAHMQDIVRILSQLRSMTDSPWPWRRAPTQHVAKWPLRGCEPIHHTCTLITPFSSPGIPALSIQLIFLPHHPRLLCPKVVPLAPDGLIDLQPRAFENSLSR